MYRFGTFHLSPLRQQWWSYSVAWRWVVAVWCQCSPKSRNTCTTERNYCIRHGHRMEQNCLRNCSRVTVWMRLRSSHRCNCWLLRMNALFCVFLVVSSRSYDANSSNNILVQAGGHIYIRSVVATRSYPQRSCSSRDSLILSVSYCFPLESLTLSQLNKA